MQSCRNLTITHFALLVSLVLCTPLASAKGPGPTFSKKFSELYVAKFFPWYSAAFDVQSNLSQKQQQTLKQILAGQHDFITQALGTYIHTFSVGFVESPSYRGPSLIVLRQEIEFDKSIAALMTHSLPKLKEKIIYHGFEVRGGKPFSIKYLANLRIFASSSLSNS